MTPLFEVVSNFQRENELSDMQTQQLLETYINDLTSIQSSPNQQKES